MDAKVTSVADFIEDARQLNSHSPAPASVPKLKFPEPGDRVQLSRLSITHDVIMDWLMLNPGRGQMAQCAEHFGYTRAWLSSMVHSDAFQAKLRDKQDKTFEGTVIPLRDQMNGVAQRAIERLGEKVEVIQDPKVLADVADKMLHRLGYAPKVNATPGGGDTTNIQNNYSVSPELLANARENAKKGDLNAAALPSPEGIQAHDSSNLGETIDLTPVICNEETQAGEEGCEVSGDSL